MDTKIFPVGSVKHVIVEQLASDAKVRGEPQAAMVQVSYQPEGAAEPAEFALEGETLYFRGGAAMRVVLPSELALTIYEASGDLRVQDLAGPLTLEAVRGDLRLRGLASRAQVGRVEGDLRVDEIAELRLVEACTGDLRVQDAGSLAIEAVGGDARLFALHAVRLGQVRGDLWAEEVTGNLEVAHAVGDIRLAAVGGFVTIQEASGDLQAADLTGGLAAQAVAGDVDLRGAFAGSQDYSLAAAGDITVVVSFAADLHMAVQAGGRIRSDVQLTPAPDGSATFTATLGRGVGHLTLHSGGDLRIVRADEESTRPGKASGEGRARPGGPEEWGNLDGLSDHIRQQVNASLSAAGIDVTGSQFGFDAGPALNARSSALVGPPRTAPPEQIREPAPAGASDAEQMMILKMVEAGTITAEQAEALLRALGGVP